MSLQETAYTNSAPNVTVTTQYTLDSTIDALCIQNPPNTGTQTHVPAALGRRWNGAGLRHSAGVDDRDRQRTPATGIGVAVLQLSGRTRDDRS